MANHSKQLHATAGASAPIAASDQPAQTTLGGPRRVWDWIDERLGLGALRYNVPVHANTFWYTLGGITFVGILVLVATGIWLAQYYNPDPAAARESVLSVSVSYTHLDVYKRQRLWFETPSVV